jgi:hypothetical protein
MQIPEE